MYSLKTDCTKSNKYREAEVALSKVFKLNGFDVIPPHSLCTKRGVYHTSATLRAELNGCLGISKTVSSSSDLVYIQDCVMGADFLVDCGNFILMVDVTQNTRHTNLLAKQGRMNSRLKVITKRGVSVKVFNKAIKKWVIKPILAGMIIGFNYTDNINFDRIIDKIDSINFSKGRVLTYATK